MRAECSTSVPDSNDLGVRGRICSSDHTIDTLANNLPPMRHNGTEWITIRVDGVT
jgi:hypothetical protein